MASGLNNGNGSETPTGETPRLLEYPSSVMVCTFEGGEKERCFFESKTAFPGAETAFSLLIRGVLPVTVNRFDEGRRAGEVGTGEAVKVPTAAMALLSR